MMVVELGRSRKMKIRHNWDKIKDNEMTKGIIQNLLNKINCVIYEFQLVMPC